MWCGTKRFEITVEKNGRTVVKEIRCEDQIDARKICRRMFSHDER